MSHVIVSIEFDSHGNLTLQELASFIKTAHAAHVDDGKDIAVNFIYDRDTTDVCGISTTTSISEQDKG